MPKDLWKKWFCHIDFKLRYIANSVPEYKSKPKWVTFIYAEMYLNNVFSKLSKK